MIHNDILLGKPEALLRATASALSTFTTEGMVGYATDTHLFGYRNATVWVYPSSGGGITGTGTDGRAIRWGTNNALDSSLVLPTGASILTLSPSATCTLTVVNTASIVGTFSGSGRILTVQTGDMKLTGGGSTSELVLANTKFSLLGGGTSCTLTLPNIALTLAGATGKSLTLTNSLTNQGGFDGVLSWGAAVTLTINQNLTLAGATGKTLTLTNSLTNQGGYDGIISWSAAVTLTVAAAASVSGTNTGDNAANSSVSYIGTTSHAGNRGTGAETLAGITLTTPNIGAATGTSVVLTGAITSSGGGIGYATGAGGAVTQGSSRTTTVVLNELCGNITMFSAAQAAAAVVVFTLTNSFIAATDMVIVTHISGTNGGCWLASVVAAAGSCVINLKNISAASITSATPLRFTVIKGVTA